MEIINNCHLQHNTCSEKYIPCLKKIPDIIDYISKQDKQILIIFGTNIPDTTGHQTTVEVPTSPNVCFCTTWGKKLCMAEPVQSRQVAGERARWCVKSARSVDALPRGIRHPRPGQS